MTREEAKELLPIMQAFAEGKTIEYRGYGGAWKVAQTPTWSSHLCYRIKPEPKYRPFRSMEECWQEMQKHQPFGWLKSKKNGRFLCIGEVSWKEGYGDVVITFYTSKLFSLYSNAAYREYTFADGAPFGVIEE